MNNFFEKEITYNRITFYLSDRPAFLEREMHPYHEMLYILEGEAELFLQGGTINAGPHTLFLIPEETYHLFKIYPEKQFLRLKISIPSDMEEPIFTRTLEKLRILEEQSEGIRQALRKLCRHLREEKEGFYAYAAFLLLIAELDMEKEEGAVRFAESGTILNRLMDYVGENLSGDLTVNRLSAVFHISPSSLTHTFRKEYGISLHRFILQKRLLYARKLISEGARPTKIYTEAGFQDYSSFYKAYTKFWGKAPSNKK